MLTTAVMQLSNYLEKLSSLLKGIAMPATVLLLFSFTVPDDDRIPPSFFGDRFATPTRAFSGLSTEKKTNLIRNLFASSKAYLNSKEFLIRYQGIREMYRPVTQNSNMGRTLLINQYENLEASVKLVSRLIQKAPKEQQQVLRNQLALIRQQQALLDDPEASMKAWHTNFPESPDHFIRNYLEKFLESTKEIDFDAVIKTGRNGKQYFAELAYESKPEAWKFCFYAGKEGTLLARKLAQEWVNQIDN